MILYLAERDFEISFPSVLRFNCKCYPAGWCVHICLESLHSVSTQSYTQNNIFNTEVFPTTLCLPVFSDSTNRHILFRYLTPLSGQVLLEAPSYLGPDTSHYVAYGNSIYFGLKNTQVFLWAWANPFSF